jgi:hypothetical protein
MIALAGEVRRWEPKRLRLQLFSIAGRLARGGRDPAKSYSCSLK